MRSPLYLALPLADSAPCGGPLTGLVAVAMFMALATWLLQVRLYGESVRVRMGLSGVAALALLGRDRTGTLDVRMNVGALCAASPCRGRGCTHFGAWGASVRPCGCRSRFFTAVAPALCGVWRLRGDASRSRVPVSVGNGIPMLSGADTASLVRDRHLSPRCV